MGNFAHAENGIILKNESQQTVSLPGGLQEILVEASGEGELTVSVGKDGVLGVREFTTIGEKAIYALAFMTEASSQPVSIKTGGRVQIHSVNLVPASDEQKKLYEKRQEEIRQLGFYNTSFQRPEPGGSVVLDRPDPNLPITRNVVTLVDPMSIETQHVNNGQRLREWLVDNGVRTLDTRDLLGWLRERLDKGDSYGSVMIFTYGSVPMEIVGDVSPSALWLKFLKNGGRIVNIGDVPFYTIRSTTLSPIPYPNNTSAENPLDVMRLPYGWNKPLWGRSLPVAITDAGKKWGMENKGGSINGFPVERLTEAFSAYHTPEGLVGSTTWFKNFNPRKPWGGFVQLQQQYDGHSDSVLRDVWRAAYYSGKAVVIPPVPSVEKTVEKGENKMILSASGIQDRSAFMPGEKIKITSKIPASFTVKYHGKSGGFNIEDEWNTAGHAEGKYQIEARWKDAGGNTKTETKDIVLRNISPREFSFQIWAELTRNCSYNSAMLAQMRGANMGIVMHNPSMRDMDEALAAGVPFNVKLMPELSPKGKTVSWEKTPEYYRLNIDRKPIPYAYAGGRPTPSICHPDVIAEVERSFAEKYKPIKDHPAFGGAIVCNDDYSILYGWDFSDHVIQRFKKETGLDAPLDTPKNRPPGIISQNDPWLAWFLFSLREISGGINRAEQRAADSVRRDTLIMPVPGGMMIPLIHPFKAGQYPPLNFGANGFSLVGSYYYNNYWQPQMTTAYWMEAGHMGNRALPEWVLADCYSSGGRAYVRNNFYHTLASGVKGIHYFTYEFRRKPQWEELKELGGILENIGPVQARLESSGRRIALLISIANLAFDDQTAIFSAYAYHNLVLAGYAVDLIAEEELFKGDAKKYSAIALHNLRWIGADAATALERYTVEGGLVLADLNTKVELKGMKRLAVDLGGDRKSYGDVAKIRSVREAVGQHLPPDFISESNTLALTKFRIGKTPYLWFVNAQSGDEYKFCMERAGSGIPGSGTLEKMLELWKWEERLLSEGDYTAQVRLQQTPVVAYDLVSQRRVPIENGKLKLQMPRFGGALIALLDSPIGKVELTSPKTNTLLSAAKLQARLISEKGELIRESLPVQFEIVSPDGTPYWNNRTVMTEDGVANFEWKADREDHLGVWKVTVRQLASGKSATSTTKLDLK